ncbi:MAG: 50S ribosomal protein L4 [Armatimonadota bacterium]
MANVKVCDLSGNQTGDMDLNADIFGANMNVPLMHQAVVSEEASMRQGTHDTKTRAEVRGGGAKPYRQKGTGRARQGTIRAPHYKKGGIVFGPTPRSYAKSMPKKMRRAAIKSALTAKFADGAIVVVDDLKMETISTKKMAETLKNLGMQKRALILLDEMTKEVMLSCRNIPGVMLRVSPAISVRDIIISDKIIMTRAAVDKLQEVYSK